MREVAPHRRVLSCRLSVVRRYLLEEAVDLAGEAAVRVRRQAQVLVAQEVVPQHGRVCERLQDGRHEARVAQVDHAAQACRQRPVLGTWGRHTRPDRIKKCFLIDAVLFRDNARVFLSPELEFDVAVALGQLG